MKVLRSALPLLLLLGTCLEAAPEGDLNRARGLARKGQFGQALEQARAAMKADPADIRAARLVQDLLTVTDGRADRTQVILPEAPDLVRKGLAARLLPPAQAVPALRAVLGKEGAPQVLRLDLATAQLALNKTRGAESDLKPYVSERPEDVEALTLLARVGMARGRWSDAQATLEKVLALSPGLAEAAVTLSEVHAAREDDAAARQVLDEALAIYPHQPVLLRALAEDQLRTGAGDKAVATLIKLLRLPVDAAPVHTRLSEAYRALAMLPEAEASAKMALEIDPKAARAMRTLGFVLQKNDKFDEALERYEQAAALRPDWCQIHVDIGFVLTLKGDTKGAAGAVDKALKLDKHHVEANLKRGILYFLEDKQKQAKQHFSVVLKSDEDDIPANRYMGYALLAQGKSKSAIKHFDKIAKLAPRDSGCMRMMGRAYLEAGRLDKAVESFQLAIGRDPKSAWAFFDLGKGLEEQENFLDAEAAYRKAIELDAKFTYPHLYLAELLEEVLDNREEALEHYKRYLELGGEDPDGDIKNRIKNLEKNP